MPSAGSVPRGGCSAPFVGARDTQGQFVSLSTNGVFTETNTIDILGNRVWTWDGAETNFFVYDGSLPGVASSSPALSWTLNVLS